MMGGPAYPYKVYVNIDGEMITIKMFGDEYSKWAETEDGYSIVQDSLNQWCYAVKDDNGLLVASTHRVQKKNVQDTLLQNYLRGVPRHMRPTKKHTTIHRQPSTAPAVGERRVLIILMEYPDLPLVKDANDFYKLFNEEGYHEDNAQGSVRDFYEAVSYGQLMLTSDIYGPYQTKHNMAYYGRNAIQGGDTNTFDLFEEAITQVSETTDLSLYDGNGDGYIDNVHIIFAGYGEEAGAAADAIWSHEATFYQPYEIQGLKIDRYSCAPELRGNSGSGISRIGPHCHEIGHALGAMDYYDTDYETNGEYQGTGTWDVMASGSWNNSGITPADFNPYVKAYNYGWIKPKAMPGGEIEIPASNMSPDHYYILSSSEGSDYYLLENRSRTGWGAGVPGDGLLIFHVSQNIANVSNKINAAAPQHCYIVCASSRYKKPSDSSGTYGNIDSDGCPYPGSSNNNSFSQSSTPQAFYWSGDECGIALNNITQLGDGSILLSNESTGAGVVPVETAEVFSENFEGNLSVSLQGNAWKQVFNPTSQTSLVTYPRAYEGKGSLQLSAEDLFFDYRADEFSFSFTPIHQTGKIKLSGYYTSSSLRSFPNTITVRYQIEDTGEWQTQTIESTRNFIWEQFSLYLPSGIIPTIYIEGMASAKSVLAVDDIKVVQEIPSVETSVQSISNDKTIEVEPLFYTLDGRRFSSPQHGINILRMADGTCRKVYIDK